jgi:CRP/FNR family transcriptional regulator, cyclic AMP receptor protein
MQQRQAARSSAAAAQKKKSGIRVLRPGEVLFEENDSANSLFIIQKGQLRLFRPKGKGFVELAVIKHGEVLGEMAFFDTDGMGNKRSCSASAIVQAEIIEISFDAFGKTIQKLNPWFRTIVNTLADRLRKTNEKIKELESNSVTVDYSSGGQKHYEFFKTVDIIRSMAIILLVSKTTGEPEEDGYVFHKNALKQYAYEIFNLMESKFEEFLNMLAEQHYLEYRKDENGQNKILVIKSHEILKNLMMFYKIQRQLTDDKRVNISFKCQDFLERILLKVDETEGAAEKTTLNLSEIMDYFVDHNIPMDMSELLSAQHAGLLDEQIVNDDGDVIADIFCTELRKMMPIIRFVNSIKRTNEKKARKK